MTNMSGIDAYKQSNQDYFEGIESPYGRIKILFDTIISSVDSMMETHPKTDFVSLGKCTNAITTLAESLNIKDGGELAQNLVELYDYSKRALREYLQVKDPKMLEEVHAIFSKLAEGWEGIDPKRHPL